MGSLARSGLSHSSSNSHIAFVMEEELEPVFHASSISYKCDKGPMQCIIKILWMALRDLCNIS